MVDNEMLSAIEELLDRKLEEKLEEKLDEKLDQKLDEKLDQKLKPIYDRLDAVDSRLDSLETDMKYVKVVQLENNVIPRLNTIEACYLDASRRLIERTEQIDTMSSDIVVLKQVVEEHSKKLDKIPV